MSEQLNDSNGFENRDDKSGENKGGFNLLKEIYDWAEALVFSLVVVILVFTFIFRIITVEGESMLQTLHPDDKLIITDINYEPQYKDIVVLNMPNFTGKPFIKRVIATEGQTVDINYTKGTVIVDGKELSEPYINELINKKSFDEMTFPLTVPKGYVFVMGDNRNHSTDSRAKMIGLIDKRYVMGRVVVQVYPLNKLGKTTFG